VKETDARIAATWKAINMKPPGVSLVEIKVLKNKYSTYSDYDLINIIKSQKLDSLTLARLNIDDAIKKDNEMKAIEEVVAERLKAKIANYGHREYDSDLINHLSSLRAYHDLIYEYEV